MAFSAVYKLICFFKAIYAQVSNVMNGCGVHHKRMSRKFQFSVLIIDVLIVNSPSIHCSFFLFLPFWGNAIFRLMLTLIHTHYSTSRVYARTHTLLRKIEFMFIDFVFIQFHFSTSIGNDCSLLTAHCSHTSSHYFWLFMNVLYARVSIYCCSLDVFCTPYFIELLKRQK